MCETLHEHFGPLCRIVAHYCGLDTDGAPTAACSAAGDQAVGAATLLGSRQMRLEQWLVLMRDSKVGVRVRVRVRFRVRFRARVRAASLLHLPFISRASPLHLPHISRISRQVCSPGFERHRVVTAFNASRGLKLHRCAGEGASS